MSRCLNFPDTDILDIIEVKISEFSRYLGYNRGRDVLIFQIQISWI
jgi:hypothetical protein